MAETRAVHVVISGLVQGVAYRAWTERRAMAFRAWTAEHVFVPLGMAGPVGCALTPDQRHLAVTSAEAPEHDPNDRFTAWNWLWIVIGALLMGATVLVNLAPPNPYLAAMLKVWQQGHFLNFNGLTRLVSAAWPFFALGYLIFLASRRREALG